jgi:hypothetical protein
MSHPRWSPPTPRIAKENLRPAAPVNWSTATSCSGDFPPVRIPTARLSQYFIVSRKKGGFVLFSVVFNMKTEEAKTVTKEERLVDFRKAALVVVNQ